MFLVHIIQFPRKNPVASNIKLLVLLLCDVDILNPLKWDFLRVTNEIRDYVFKNGKWAKRCV